MNNKPEKITIAPKKYAFCTCGLSKQFPQCDGSHVGTSHVPKIEEVVEAKDVYICMCGKSKNTPFCDGSHIALEENKNG